MGDATELLRHRYIWGGMALGNLSAWPTQSGYNFDIMELPWGTFQTLERNGFTNIEIIERGTLNSSRGTLCDAYLYLSCTKNGTNYVFYYEWLEGKHYATALSLVSTTRGWSNHYDTLRTIVNSVCFASGEEI